MGSAGFLSGKRRQAGHAGSARRGATRLSPPVTARKERKKASVQVNWLLVRRVLYVFMAVIALGLLLEGWRHALPHINQPIGRIVVKGNLSELHQGTLEQRVAPFVNSGFLTVDIDAIQHSLEQVPWVGKADISRVWPNQLAIEVEEHKPVALWGNDELLNSQAHVFSRQGMTGYQLLPQLAGPEGSQDAVMQQYRLLNQALRPLGQTVEKLEMRERGSWFVTTGTGLELWLGREQVMEKMRRLVTLYEKELREQMNQIARIDLRYANGLAVTWRETASENAVVQ